ESDVDVALGIKAGGIDRRTAEWGGQGSVRSIHHRLIELVDNKLLDLGRIPLALGIGPRIGEEAHLPIYKRGTAVERRGDTCSIQQIAERAVIIGVGNL